VIVGIVARGVAVEAAGAVVQRRAVEEEEGDFAVDAVDGRVET
jgi:hypothetical protein